MEVETGIYWYVDMTGVLNNYKSKCDDIIPMWEVNRIEKKKKKKIGKVKGEVWHSYIIQVNYHWFVN